MGAKLPKHAFTYNSLITATEDLQYAQSSFNELLKATESAFEDEAVIEPIVLLGNAGSGKTHLLRLLADYLGFVYSQIDCLAHLNLNQLSTLLSATIPAQSANLPHVVELISFEKYSLWFEGSQG